MGKRSRQGNRSRRSKKQRATPSNRLQPERGAPRKQQLIAATEAHRAGDFVTAKSLYESLLASDPRDPDALHLLGVLHHQAGDHDSAVEMIENAIAIKGDSASFYSNLSKALHDRQQFHRAIDAAREALKLDPNLLSASTNMGFALLSYGRRIEAETYFRRVLERQPDNLCVLTALARLYEYENRVDEALEIVNCHLSRDPGNLGLSITAANLQRRLGNIPQAMSHLEEARRAEPSNASSPHLHFELGRLHDELGDYDHAFSAFLQAKSLQRATRARDETQRQRSYEQLAELQQIFTSDWVQSWKSLGAPPSTQSPVFVFGFPRSGNTLVDQILNSHSQLQTVIEKPMMEVVQQAVEQQVDVFPRALARLSTDQAEHLRAIYFDMADQFIERRTGLRLVDTFPLNTPRIGLIHRLFPTAKLILVLRHPCDVCLSCFMQNFLDPSVRERFHSLDDVVTEYSRTMDLWQQYREVLSLDIRVVRYEHLVEDLERETQALCAHLEIPWESAMCQFDSHARNRSEITTASYAQVTQGIYGRSRHRWLNYAQHLDPVLPRLAPYAAQYDYSLDPQNK